MSICGNCEFNKPCTITRYVSGGIEISNVRRCSNKEKWGKVSHVLLPPNAKKCTGWKPKRRCENCAHYKIIKDGTQNRDHEEELRESVDNLGCENLFFNEDGSMKEPNKHYEYVECDKGNLEDEADFMTNKAKDCPDYKSKEASP